MKKILIVSDSHHHNEILNQIFKAHSEIDTCIHCGDLQDQPDYLNIKQLLIVSGNNDFNQFDQEIITEIDHQRILILHGDRQNIELGSQEIEEKAQSLKANIVCFGHTHHPQFFLKDSIYYINPGSTSFPRGGKVFIPTYAILTIDERIECHFYHAKSHKLVDDVVFKEKVTKKRSFFSFLKK